MSKNKLIEIAEILREIKKERVLDDIPKEIKSRYPSDSVGIKINGKKWIVVDNEKEGSEETDDKAVTSQVLKYNPNFFFATTGAEDIELIDDQHNKGILLDEAYTEVSYLRKDVEKEDESLDKEEARNALVNVIDFNHLNVNDFDDIGISESLRNNRKAYDNVYRCRCISSDVAGNQMVDSILIKAYKVSNKETSYETINNENIKNYIENLEDEITKDSSNIVNSSQINDSEYDEIYTHINNALNKFYTENADKSRVARVDVKAIYSLRLKKIPFTVSFKADSTTVARIHTYYSKLAKEFNIFSCPTCKSLSTNKKSTSINFHVDHDYFSEDNDDSPIGCTKCMEKCARCGRWHFKLDNDVEDTGYTLRSPRKFLKSLKGSKKRVDEFCSCKEYLTWMYDEMSYIEKRNSDNEIIERESYNEKIIENLFRNQCKLVFVNYLTGEVLTKYDDFVAYFHEYLMTYLDKSRQKDILNKYKDLKVKDGSKADPIKAQVHRFIESYLINTDDEYEGFDLRGVVENAISDFKAHISGQLNIKVDYIKCTSERNCSVCKSCEAMYYSIENKESESYYNTIKEYCCCCDQATSGNRSLKVWNRIDDNVLFYRAPKTGKITRVFQSEIGEVLYDDWKKSIREKAIKGLKQNNIGKEVMK